MARADAELRRAENLAAATEMQVRLDLQYAVNAVDVNRARVRYIEEEYLGAARQSREIVLASYELGAGPLMDFLDAQRAHRVTQQTSNQALYDLWISLFRLEAALGLPLELTGDTP